jgi:AraC-like DNA-binding protein
MSSQFSISEVKNINELFLERLYDLVKKNIQHSDLNVDMLSKAMDVSRSTLNRRLKVLLGLSTNQLIKNCRMMQAAELINAGHGIAQAAFQVGIENPSYFSQCFKEVYGKSPSEFRKSST